MTNCSMKPTRKPPYVSATELVGRERVARASGHPRSQRRAAARSACAGRATWVRWLVPGVEHPAHPVGLGGAHRGVAQSTSQIATRPPGRSARRISARAAGMSATYSSTWTLRAASKSASPTGSEVASPWTNSAFGLPLIASPSERQHRRAAVDADDRALRADLLERARRRRSPGRSRRRGPARRVERRSPRGPRRDGGARRATSRPPRSARDVSSSNSSWPIAGGQASAPARDRRR